MRSWNKILHGSLLIGEDGGALLSAARSMAQTLLCPEGHRGEDYGSCRCCRKIFADIHPDISYIRRGLQKDGKTLRAEIVVDQIRSVAADSVVLPNDGDCKLYIFPEADALNTSAQNALLKLLEEPPQGVYFLLCARNAEGLLPTVRSRCALYRIQGQEAETDESILTLCREYLDALGDELSLLLWQARAEKLDLAAFRTLVPALKEEAVMKLKGKELLALESQLTECSEMLRVNVNSRHLAAMLATFRNQDNRNEDKYFD